MSDLHARLKFEIEMRKMVAEAATPGPWEYATVRGVTSVGAPGLLPSVASDVAFDANVHYLVSHSPDDAIRRHEAALRVLERHRAEDGCCPNCGRLREDWVYDSETDEEFRETDWDAQPWPCPDIRTLAASYGVEVESEASGGRERGEWR